MTLLHSCLRPVAMLPAAFALLLGGCAGSGLIPTPAPTSTPTALPLAEVRVVATQASLRPGEATELVAEGRTSAGWTEVKAIWRAQPADLGLLEVPLQQREGLSRTWFTAKESGQVTITAEPAESAGPVASVALTILAKPTAAVPPLSPSAAIRGPASPGPASPAGTPMVLSTRTPRPTPNVVDSPQLRQAIAELDRLDRQVLGVADAYVFTFRQFLDKKVTQEQACEAIAAAMPRAQSATTDLTSFAPPQELSSVHEQYVMVAEDLQKGLLALSDFCRTSDLSLAKAYFELVPGAIAKSVLAKQQLDAIAVAIGLPPPRSTRFPSPTRLP